MSKKHVIAIVLLLVGAACHAQGLTFSPADQQALIHGLGILFDLAFLKVFFGTKGPPPGDDRQPTGNWPPVVGILFAAVALMNVGCASNDPRTTVHQFRKVNALVAEEAGSLYDARLLSKRDLRQVKAAVESVQAILDIAEPLAVRIADARAGGPPVDLSDEQQFDRLLDDVRTAIRAATKLKNDLQEARRRRADPVAPVRGDGGVPGGTVGGSPATRPGADAGGDRRGEGPRAGGHRRLAVAA